MEVLDNVTLSNYEFMFDFERQFDYHKQGNWLNQNWTLALHISVAYVILIYSLQNYMKSRSPVQCKFWLILWNGGLAVFSIFGFFRTAPEFFYTVYYRGIRASICSSSFLEDNQVTAFWIWLFNLSKVVELGDTIFLVLRKRPVIFLHWYHHASVLIYTWFASGQFSSSGRWFTNINYFIHSLMYSYFCLTAMGYRVPKNISVTITSLQILQMVMGMYVNYSVSWYLNQGFPCNVSRQCLQAASIMYLSYLVLFSHFFYNSYLAKPKKRSAKNE